MPRSAGPLRDYWLATDARDGKPPVIGAEISSVGETYEGLMDGRGIVLLASGNAPLVALDGVITRPVRGLSPSRLALAWRAGDDRPLDTRLRPRLPADSRVSKPACRKRTSGTR